jgi:hypothetical protein
MYLLSEGNGVHEAIVAQARSYLGLVKFLLLGFCPEGHPLPSIFFFLETS